MKCQERTTDGLSIENNFFMCVTNLYQVRICFVNIAVKEKTFRILASRTLLLFTLYSLPTEQVNLIMVEGGWPYLRAETSR